jgi:hypothetical protein
MLLVPASVHLNGRQHAWFTHDVPTGAQFPLHVPTVAPLNGSHLLLQHSPDAWHVPVVPRQAPHVESERHTAPSAWHVVPASSPTQLTLASPPASPTVPWSGASFALASLGASLFVASPGEASGAVVSG